MFEIEDRRVRKTRASLLEALITLTTRVGWADVNVRMICEEADVSRSTFYGHFNNKHELLDYGFELLSAEIGGNSHGRSLDAGDQFAFLPDLLAHIEGHKHLFKANDTTPSNQMVFGRFRRIVDDMGLQEIRASSYANRLGEAEIAFLSGGIFAVLNSWRAASCTRPIPAVLQDLDRMVAGFLATAAA